MSSARFIASVSASFDRALVRVANILDDAGTVSRAVKKRDDPFASIHTVTRTRQRYATRQLPLTLLRPPSCTRSNVSRLHPSKPKIRFASAIACHPSTYQALWFFSPALFASGFCKLRLLFCAVSIGALLLDRMARRLAIAKLAAWDRLTGFERRLDFRFVRRARDLTDRPAMTLGSGSPTSFAAARAKRKRRLGKLSLGQSTSVHDWCEAAQAINAPAEAIPCAPGSSSRSFHLPSASALASSILRTIDVNRSNASVSPSIMSDAGFHPRPHSVRDWRFVAGQLPDQAAWGLPDPMQSTACRPDQDRALVFEQMFAAPRCSCAAHFR